MGISDKIEDATISIDEATILEIKATIALLFLLSLTMIALQGRHRSCKKCAARSEILFFCFHRRCVCTDEDR